MNTQFKIRVFDEIPRLDSGVEVRVGSLFRVRDKHYLEGFLVLVVELERTAKDGGTYFDVRKVRALCEDEIYWIWISDLEEVEL